MYLSTYNFLLRIKNPQTKFKMLKYLTNMDAIDPSIGLAYVRGSFKIVRIY